MKENVDKMVFSPLFETLDVICDADIRDKNPILQQNACFLACWGRSLLYDVGRYDNYIHVLIPSP